MPSISYLVVVLGSVVIWLLVSFNVFNSFFPDRSSRKLASAPERVKATPKAVTDASAALLRDFQTEVLTSMVDSIVIHKSAHYKLLANKKDREYRDKYFLWPVSANDSALNGYTVDQSNLVDLSRLNPSLFDKVSRQELKYKQTEGMANPLVPRQEMLIVLTTCNQLKMTIFALEYLRETYSAADFLVVDDHSIDGTVDYLIKKGYAVVSKAKAQGLTDSWNKGYEIAVALGYKYLIYTNNDVLVSLSGVRIMQQDLRNEALVVPLTSAKGSGHNPSQSLVRAYRMREYLDDYVDNYRHFELIQAALDKISANTSLYHHPHNKDVPFARVIPSMWRRKWRFNGFFFGVNLARIAPAAQAHPTHLFDAANLMVGQEDSLMDRMEALKLAPKIAMCVFIYHFKSITVGSATMKNIHSLKRIERLDANYSRVTGKKFGIKVDVKSGNGSTSSVTMDIRDDLRFYHPEHIKKKTGAVPAAAAASAGLSRTMLNVVNRVDKKSRVLLAAADEPSLRLPREYPDMSVLVTYPELYHSYPALMTDTSAEVFPSFEDVLSSLNRSKSLLRASKAGSSRSAAEVAALDVDIGHVRRTLEFKSRVIIGFAISDPVRTPAAGDIFTAQELGDVLERDFNVEVRYLRRGVQWYSPRHLCDLDVLVTMLDAYELGRALAVVRSARDTPYYGISGYDRASIKSGLVTVAWMRNWFHRWLTQPWMGNYDLLLVSSPTAKAFFESVGSSAGFRVQCVMGCPSTDYPRFMPLEEGRGKFEPEEGGRHFLMSRRVVVPVEQLSLATNHYLFTPPNASLAVPAAPKAKPWRLRSNKGSTPAPTGPPTEAVASAKYRADYVFTGSYYNVPRKVMDFDPASLPRSRGLIVGEGWEAANVSAAWKRACIGPLPYDQMPLVYRNVKIVIDDANHVTMPWGSVNSRVFDALASGALVVTNGRAGFEATFGRLLTNLSMPLFYTSGAELTRVLEYYLRNAKERLAVADTLRRAVLAGHTYSARARQLSGLLGGLGIALQPSENSKLLVRRSSGPVVSEPRKRRRRPRTRTPAPTKSKLAAPKAPAKPAPPKPAAPKTVTLKRRLEEAEEPSVGLYEAAGRADEDAEVEQSPARKLWSPASDDILQISAEMERRTPPANESSICIGIRTIEAQTGWLEILVRSLAQQYMRSPFKSQIDLKIFIVNTDVESAQFAATLAALVSRINGEYGLKMAFVLSDPQAQPRAYKNPFYGYDSTDFLVAHMVSLYTQTLHERMFMSAHHHAYYSSHFLSTSQTPCEWLLLTNGDNLYNSAWFSTVAPFVLNRNMNAIGWDFVTHHPRGDNLDQSEQVISVAIKRQFVDLGSLMMRTRLYIGSKTTFLNDAVFTKEIFTRDFFTYAALLRNVGEKTVQLIHNCLLFHQ